MEAKCEKEKVRLNLGNTHYSSSTSFGKWSVQSSSLRQIGRPNRMDIDLSAVQTRPPHSSQSNLGVSKTTQIEPRHVKTDARANRHSIFVKGDGPSSFFDSREETKTHHQKATKKHADEFHIQWDPSLRTRLPHAYVELPQYARLHRKKHVKSRHGLRRNDRQCH